MITSGGEMPENRTIIGVLRDFVKRIEPGLSEAVKWGNGCWVRKKGPVAYVYAATGYVQFGFFSGSSLKDPTGLLEGEGKGTCGMLKCVILPKSTSARLQPSSGKPRACVRN